MKNKTKPYNCVSNASNAVISWHGNSVPRVEYIHASGYIFVFDHIFLDFITPIEGSYNKFCSLVQILLGHKT